jgi:hypothetical protein
MVCDATREEERQYRGRRYEIEHWEVNAIAERVALIGHAGPDVVIDDRVTNRDRLIASDVTGLHTSWL